MKHLLNAVMALRAAQLASWIEPYLPDQGYAADIGAGTGHNTLALSRRSRLTFVGVDVTSLHVVGRQPVLFNGLRLPFASGRFACALVLFVLQYASDPVHLLRETGRVTAGPLLVLQSTYEGQPGRVALALNDYLWGPVALNVAQHVGLVNARRCTLHALRHYTRPTLLETFGAAGFEAQIVRSMHWPLVPVRYDLFLLTQRSSSC